MNVALRPDSINLISLCTGGGGLDLGVELAMPSARSVVLVEREAFAASQLVSAIQQGLLAEAAVWSDVATFDGRPWRGIVDGVIGGIPCQPHSLAGKRLGENDERDLWSDARRVIVQSGAWFVLIENVRGMLSSGGAERVWRDLLRLGFDVEGGLFTASEVGASHERERIFILAVAGRDNQYDYRSGIERSRWWRQSTDGGGVVADTGCDSLKRRRAAGDISGAPRSGEGQGSERQRDGHSAGDGSAALVDAPRERWREGRTESELRSGRDSVTSADNAMGDAVGGGHDGRPDGAVGRSIGRAAAKGPSERIDGKFNAGLSDEKLVADAYCTQPPPQRRNDGEMRRRSEGESKSKHSAALSGRSGLGAIGLFPPGPSDLHSWRHTLALSPELEPAFRRVADGLASRLDVARVDRLRMLGNGVVCLEGAYAFRTLAARLAASGSIGAARLIRMMNLLEAA